jgi:hypothetical protein
MSAKSNGRGASLGRIAARLGVSLLIGGGFVYALQRGGLPFVPANALSGVSAWGIPTFVGLMGLCVYIRTKRWFYMLEPLAPGLRPWRVFGIGLVGFAAIFFGPLRLGEMVRPYMLSQDGEVRFVEAVGTVAAERIIDGIVMMALTAIALAASTPLAHLPSQVGALPIPVALVPGAIVAGSATFGLAFTLMMIFYFARDTARRVVRKVVGIVSTRLADFCAGVVERLAESLGFLPSWRRLAPFLRDTLLYWVLMGLAQYSLLRGVGLNTTVPQAFVTLGVASLGSLLPAGPGFFGAYQVSTYTSLAMYHAESELLSKGAVFVFISYVCLVAVTAAGGVVGMLLLARTPPRGGREPGSSASR